MLYDVLHELMLVFKKAFQLLDNYDKISVIAPFVYTLASYENATVIIWNFE